MQNHPKQLLQFIEYSKNLKYDENPDYNYLNNLFLSTMKENELRIEYMYDWDNEDTYREKILLKNQSQQRQQDQLQSNNQIKNTNYSQYHNNRQSVMKTKTSSIHSINKVSVLKIQQNLNTQNRQNANTKKKPIDNKVKSITAKC